MIVFAVALVLTAAGVGALLPVLHRAKVLDVPNTRSSHDYPIPRGGGIAVMTGILLASATAAAAGNVVPWPLLGAGVLLAIVGFVDDLHSLGSLVRLGAQLVVGAAVAVWAGLSETAGALPLGIYVGLATIVVVGYVNAFNFMDGINGISAMSAVVAGSWYAWLGGAHELESLSVLGLALAGAALGFLPWNAPRARIFLGDVGSYGVGLLIAGAAAVAWFAKTPLLLCIAPLVVYGVDTGWTLVKRAANGKPLMEAHRDHVYQRLVDAGWPHVGSAATSVVFSLAIMLVALLDHGLVGWTTAAVIAAGYLAVPKLFFRQHSPVVSR